MEKVARDTVSVYIEETMYKYNIGRKEASRMVAEALQSMNVQVALANQIEKTTNAKPVNWQDREQGK